MADEVQRWQQYEYKANSNLVIQSDRRNLSKEPTGEVESIIGKGTLRMGDRALRTKAEVSRDKAKRTHDDDDEGKARKRQKKIMTVVDAVDSTGYHPKTRETRAAWEQVLSFVHTYIGDQPADILHGAAEEAITLLKDDSLQDRDRQREISKLIGPVADDRFAVIVNLGKRITDFEVEDAQDGEAGIDDEHGVAVVFEEEEDENEGGLVDALADEGSGSEDEEGLEDVHQTSALKVRDEDMDDDEVDESLLNPVNIDAYWLQREIAKGSQNQDNATESQDLAGQVLEALRTKDARELENQLVALLDFERFELIKILLKNRTVVLYATLLKSAQNDKERSAVEAEMQQDPEGRAVLAALTISHKTEDERKKDYERAIRKEIRDLRAGQGDDEVDGDALAREGVDLEDLAFQQGSHLMTNKKCELPPGSKRLEKRGYEEVHIPAPKPAAFAQNEALVEIESLPNWAQAGFKNMKSLNRLQSKVYKTALFDADNMLVCAPTGAGKTNVAMLSILHEVGLHRNEDNSIRADEFKIIYIAPMKALVAEVVANFSKRLEPFGLSVKELTGDVSLTKQQIAETTMIVTTPEKWDIVTRKSGDRAYTQLVRLVIIDEIHLLHDSRGPVLEAIIARTIRQIESTQDMVRLVGLSATLPNFKDVAKFMRVNSDKGLFYFDGSYRPVPLHQQYIGVMEKKPLKRFQVMNEVTYDKVMERAGKSQVMVFVHSRKETAKTAQAIKEMAEENETLEKIVTQDSAAAEILKEMAEDVANPDLKKLLPFGFGIHHAGMLRKDRELVEELFADGHIQVLVSTATLAWGVNLPAHTVIIKGTQIYSPEKSAWVELSPMDVMQMMGRAGRPQFDTSGEGIIITQHSELQYYLSLLNQQLPIESQMIKSLADMLNAEVVMGSIRNMKEAVAWVGYTYLFVRMLRNPRLYGVPSDAKENDPRLEKRRGDLVHAAASQLLKCNLIKYDRKSGALAATDLGRVAAHFYVSHDTIATYNEHLKPSMSDIELFRLFSLSGEFRFIAVRQEEKIELEKLLERVPIPVKESIEEPTAKVNVLLQAYISQLKLDGLALLSDMVYVQQSAGRLMRAIFEIAHRRGWAQLSQRALTCCKMVDRRMWGSMSPLRQFKRLPVEVVRSIERKQDFSFDRLFDLDAYQLGELVRVPKIGKALHKYIHQVPKLDLEAAVLPVTRSCLQIDVKVTPDFQWDEGAHGTAEVFHVFVEDVDGETILHHEMFVLKQRFAQEEHHLSFTVPIYEPLPPQYFLKIVSDRWLGSEASLPITFRYLILPEKYPPHTELLDLQPLPVSTLNSSKYERLFSDFKTFNPIQTQTFNPLLKADDNILICAPAGSGKTVCAELALLRLFSEKQSGKAVYVAPLQQIVSEIKTQWVYKFGKLLGLTVVELTGESGPDLKLLAAGNIILSTPEKWDAVTRRWKQRKNVQAVDLCIFDKLHMIGGQSGPTLEVIVSRMRYIEAQIERKIRLVGLATSLANARDVADWMGASASGNLFNFHPNVRPVPLDIHIQGFEAPHFSSRMLAMLRPTYSTVTDHADGKPAAVFVSDRKQARITAVDLATLAAAEGKPTRFLKVKQAQIEKYIGAIKDKTLKEVAAVGVLYFHDALSKADQEIVGQLFDAGACSLVVVSHSALWERRWPAHVVTIMGTQYWDGREHRHEDYPVSDILQMMGSASRPLIDTSDKCFLLCHTPRKQYYKKFLYDPLPVESHLDQFLHDHVNAEVVSQTIESKGEAVDFLTWSFFYYRLRQNPNYYNMQGTSHQHVSDHLSELVETVITDLEDSRCVEVEDEMEVGPLNLGMISSYYYIHYTTIELFASSLKQKHRLKPLVELLAASSEFEELPLRRSEDKALLQLAHHMPQKIEKPKFTDPHTKSNLLLQAHFSRINLTQDLAQDQHLIVEKSIRLLYAMVDVVSSNSWLKTALAAMELCQMIVQGMWATDSHLLQLPHITKDIAKRCTQAGMESIFDLLEAEDEDRNKLLQLTEEQMVDVAAVANRYPAVDVEIEVIDSDDVVAEQPTTVVVTLQRETEDEEVTPVTTPFFPKPKEEGWWLVVGQPDNDNLLTIKRVTFGLQSKVKLQFVPPSSGQHKFTLFMMCDSWVGVDQEHEFEMSVGEAMEEDDQ